MTEPTDKQLEDFAVEEQFLLFCDVDEFTQIARAVLAKWGNPAPVGVEQVGWMWQHDETGRTGFVDCWQVENGWQEGNPRLRLISKLYTTPQPTQPQAVNQADRPFIVRLAEDFAEDCVTAGYVTTKAASYGRLMNEALSTQAQAGAVPLTDEQIQEAILPINPHGMGYFLRIAHAIERAHGIT